MGNGWPSLLGCAVTLCRAAHHGHSVAHFGEHRVVSRIAVQVVEERVLVEYEVVDIAVVESSLERVERRLPPRIRHTERPEPLLAIALGFALIEIASTRVFGRRTP